MTSAEKTRIRSKWKRWATTIGRDLGWLLTSHEIFLAIQRTFVSNKLIQQPPLVYRWFSSNDAARISAGVRRVTDHDSRAISLYRLIKEIEANPQAMTQRDVVSEYPKSMQEDGLAQGDFRQFAGRGGLTLSQPKLRSDLARLDRTVSRVRTFVDKYVAHCDADQKGFPAPPMMMWGKPCMTQTPCTANTSCSSHSPT